jgi:hypothetical protein
LLPLSLSPTANTVLKRIWKHTNCANHECLLACLLTYTHQHYISFVVFQDHNWLWLHQDSVSQQQSVSTSNNSTHCTVLHLGN